MNKTLPAITLLLALVVVILGAYVRSYRHMGLALLTFATALPAGGGYTAGELKEGESTTITYNAIIK